MKEKILVTGGAGFIGSEFIRQAVKKSRDIAVIDKLTYAADLERLKEAGGGFRFYKADICNRRQVERIFKKERPDKVIHFAAETHVDRSILNSDPFIQTNIQGTKALLDLSRKYGVSKFCHISTDEVYGEITSGSFREDSPLKPNSPYAASKAAADLLVAAYIKTYDFPALIIRPSNNYGPWQYPEKLIPLAILKAMQDKKVPVYAKGENVREWLYVADCVRGIRCILQKGEIGEVYNLGSGQERKNVEVVRGILKELNKQESLIEFVKDRPGHDFRYSLECLKAKNNCSWKPRIKFDQGLRETVKWFKSNGKWLSKHSGKKLSIRFK